MAAWYLNLRAGIIAAAFYLLETVLAEARCRPEDLHGIAYTAGPGLMGALLVGATFGRTLAFSSAFPPRGPSYGGPPPGTPPRTGPAGLSFVALLVSGGHTLSWMWRGSDATPCWGNPSTMRLGKPLIRPRSFWACPTPAAPSGGPRAKRRSRKGRPLRFPRPMLDRPGLDFSFSGLKTAVLTATRRVEAEGTLDAGERAAIAAAFEEAVVDTLVRKAERAWHNRDAIVWLSPGACRRTSGFGKRWTPGLLPKAPGPTWRAPPSARITAL